MAPIKKKGTTGAVVNYISRRQALKKLQVSLKDFRRLCILKGIYPRDPPNKKKLNLGSSAPNTWYFRKDIHFLHHEPLLQKFRDWKVFARKLAKAVNKRNYSAAENLNDNRPKFAIDHIIKERYPSFNDALNDMDDALSMVFLFASMRSINTIENDLLERVHTKSLEFVQYVIHTQCLRKTFISIKGIYYLVEIRGQQVTWVTPHQFSQQPTSDVDFKVMGTFLELYDTLLGFVLFKLYTDAGLKYPPTLNSELDKDGGGVAALILQKSAQHPSSELPSAPKPTPHKLTASEKRRLERVKAQLANLKPEGDSAPISDEQRADLGLEEEHEDVELADDFDACTGTDVQGDTCDLNVEPVITYSMLTQTASAHKSLFSNLVFYLSREVSRASVEFIVKSFGGKVGWDAVAGAGSVIKEDDSSITHHVVDRPSAPTQALPTRTYIQPQWVFDCVNAGKLLLVSGANPGEGYGPGQTLPPHLSPFEVKTDESYDPNATYDDDKVVELALADSDDEVEHEPMGAEDEEEAMDSPAAKSKAELALAKKQALAESDKLAMSKILMSNRNKHLFNKIERAKNQKIAAAENLKRKKSMVDGRASKKVKTIRI